MYSGSDTQERAFTDELRAHVKIRMKGRTYLVDALNFFYDNKVKNPQTVYKVGNFLRSQAIIVSEDSLCTMELISMKIGNRDSVFSIVTGYRLDN
jgi:hypothetical protein